MKAPLILAVLAALIVLRWTHLFWACEQSRRDIPRPPRSRDHDWPATALGLLYGFALVLCLSRCRNADQFTTVRGVSALSLMSAGVLLRLAGQSAIRSAFSWYWTPSSSLITTGIYRWMKHPLLLGYLLETASLFVVAPLRPLDSGLLIAATALLIWLQAISEEKRLDVNFGDQWRSFARGK